MRRKLVILLGLIGLLSLGFLWAQEKKSEESAKPKSEQPVIKEQQKEISPELKTQIEELIKKLGSNYQKTRDKGQTDIEKIMEDVGIEKVEPLLKELLSSTNDPEVQARINQLLRIPERRFEELNYPQRQGWKEEIIDEDGYNQIMEGFSYNKKEVEQKFDLLRKYRGYHYKEKPGTLDIPGKIIVDYRGNSFESHELSSEKFRNILKDEGIKINDVKMAEKIAVTYLEMLDLAMNSAVKEIKSEETKNGYRIKILAHILMSPSLSEAAEWEFEISKDRNSFVAKKSKVIKVDTIDYE